MIESMWFVFGGVIAPLLAAMMLVIWVQPWRGVSKFSTESAWNMAVFAGFGGGYLLLLVSKRALPMPPVEALHLLVMVALPVVAGVEIIGSIQVLGRPFPWLLRVVILALLPAFLLQPYLKNTWTPGQGAAWLGGLFLLLISGRVVLHHLTKNRQERSAWLAMGMAAAGAGVTMLASGSVELGQAGLTLATALGGAWIAAVIFRVPGLLNAGLGVAWVMLAGLLICACFYAELSLPDAAILIAAPLSASVVKLPVLQRRGAITRAMVVLLISTIIAAMAAAPAAHRAMLAAESNSENPYGQ